MKKLMYFSAVIFLNVYHISAFTPITYINSRPHNTYSPYALSTPIEFMREKPSTLAPSFYQIHTLLVSQVESLYSYAAYTLGLNYHQKLDAAVKGLFFDLYLPITFVENKLSDIHDVEIFAKKAGIADLALNAGWMFLHKNSDQLTLNIDVSIPTSNKDEFKGKAPYSPAFGNNGHIASGLCLDGNLALLKHKKHMLELTGFGQYHFLSQARKQTLFIPTNAGYDDGLVTISRHSIIDLGQTLRYHYKTLFVDLGIYYQWISRWRIKVDTQPILTKNRDIAILNSQKIHLYRIETDSQMAWINDSDLLQLHADFGFAKKEFPHPFALHKKDQCPGVSAYTSFGVTATLWASDFRSWWDLHFKVGFAV